MTTKEELQEIFKQKNWPGWLARNRPLLLAELKRLTNFVPEDFPLVVRAWHITNEIYLDKS